MTDEETAYSKANENMMHKTIRKVTSDIDQLKANTALAQLMTLVNQLSDKGCNRAELDTLLRLVSPFAPHLAEELWHQHGFAGYCSLAAWPTYDEAKTRKAVQEFIFQVNGKVRSKTEADPSISKDDLLALAKSDEKIKGWIAGKTIVKEIVVPGKLVNIVVK